MRVRFLQHLRLRGKDPWRGTEGPHPAACEEGRDAGGSA